ncbi:hypothetical protein C4901_13190 [Acidiferrobacter sp. SPIII_3]|jgi:prepilin-type N-terminal cleavage/methylation domain-containing protein|uniref:pilus assembly FimT family protein n=1 Tax=Acidiferrobacter sp. SPIII_3 TaxID=1281578 RepID=UPI000D7E236F|nr:GspH/FimT family pseudopilin [Acidiferrobacter sp. SPIII_3]AWP24160.1 hypothetical protein C4901_13190 [Acidiferrobacter sp. SPIII_3]
MRQSGLTLLELIAVLVIMSAAMALVGLPLFGQHETLTAYSRRARSLVHLARRMALTQGVVEELCIDPRTRTITLRGLVSDKPLRRRALRVPHSIRVTVSAKVGRDSYGRRIFRFYPDGSATPGTIIFQRGARRLPIMVGVLFHASH